MSEIVEVAPLRCKVDGGHLSPVPYGTPLPSGSLHCNHCGAVHNPDGSKYFAKSITASNDLVAQLNARIEALESREVQKDIVIDREEVRHKIPGVVDDSVDEINGPAAVK